METPEPTPGQDVSDDTWALDCAALDEIAAFLGFTPPPKLAGRRHDKDHDPILVAVDGRERERDALDWAAAEAASRGSALRIAHAIDWPRLTIDPLGGVSQNWRDTSVPTRGEAILEEAAQRALLVAPGITVTTHLATGSAASAIGGSGHQDSLTVMGRGARRHIGSRSGGWRVVRRAASTVTIVELAPEGSDGPSANRVVVGVDESGGPASALGEAFRAASRRGVGLTVIHAKSPSTWFPHPARTIIDDMDVLRRIARIDATLEPYREAFPNVGIRRRFVSGAPARAIVDESVAAALVVIGAPRRGRVRNAVRRSVAHAVFRGARTTIVMVREPPQGSDQGRRRAR